MGFEDPWYKDAIPKTTGQSFFDPILFPFFHLAWQGFFTLPDFKLLELDQSVLTFQFKSPNLLLYGKPTNSR